MGLFQKQKRSDLTDATQRLRIQYRAMINQVILVAVGGVFLFMGFRNEGNQDNAVVLILCGVLLMVMGMARIGLCYYLFHHIEDDDAEKE